MKDGGKKKDCAENKKKNQIPECGEAAKEFTAQVQKRKSCTEIQKKKGGGSKKSVTGGNFCHKEKIILQSLECIYGG